MDSNITISELQSLFQLAVDKLRNDNIELIPIATDNYWIITTDEWDNFDSPPSPAVGSLREDLTNLKRSIREKEIITFSDFDRLAAVLRVISEIYAPTPNGKNIDTQKNE